MIEPVSISLYSAGKLPSVSVLLPVYNGGSYLKQSLQSVLNQQFTDFELLIIDDCSNDSSFEYLKSISDPRISLFQNSKNKGLFYNLNYLISQTKSPLIKLWAQDDVMYSQCLASFVSFHAAHPHIGFSYSGRDIINEHGEIKENKRIDTTPEIISTTLHARIAYFTGSIAGNIANVCISKAALDKVGLFNEQMKISADFDMWVRLAKDHDTGFIKEKLIQLRDHDNQLSRNEKYYINHVKEDMEVYHYLDSYVSDEQRREGHKTMRKNKMVFYYTLMIKSFLRGDLKTGRQYFKLLSSYDNIFLCSIYFFRKKIFG
ncbi:MAG: glycosyltransferase [Bacteroidetes bacterium]|nr:glycosyltransferase [Bacteroidota bacterium]